MNVCFAVQGILFLSSESEFPDGKEKSYLFLMRLYGLLSLCNLAIEKFGEIELKFTANAFW